MLKQFSRRQLWLGAIVLFALLALIILLAPSARPTAGSSYTRSPDGYGAWFAYMQQQGVTIERWQKPLQDLEQNPATSSQTLLQVYETQSAPRFVQGELQHWLSQGNRLVILSRQGQATDAPFTSRHATDFGSLTVETTRRLNSRLVASVEPLLSDRYGPIVWRKKVGKGEVIYASTPYLAANAYQDSPGNFAFLAQLVSPNSRRDRVYVDEYIHGYKDTQTLRKEGRGNFVNYLAVTPVALLVVQAGVMVAIAIYGQNRRFGPPLRLPTPTPNNSKAYIQALAGVLQKANCSDFVLEMVGKAEQTHLQQQLGQGRQPCSPEHLIAAWDEQIRQPHTELKQVLQLPQRKRRIHDRALMQWLNQLESLRKTVEKAKNQSAKDPVNRKLENPKES